MSITMINIMITVYWKVVEEKYNARESSYNHLALSSTLA